MMLCKQREKNGRSRADKDLAQSINVYHLRDLTVKQGLSIQEPIFSIEEDHDMDVRITMEAKYQWTISITDSHYNLSMQVYYWNWFQVQAFFCSDFEAQVWTTPSKGFSLSSKTRNCGSTDGCGKFWQKVNPARWHGWTNSNQCIDNVQSLITWLFRHFFN